MRFRRKPKPSRGFAQSRVDVRTMRLQCDLCGVPVDEMETVEDASTATGTNALFRPCGHSAIPEYREERKP